MLTNITSTQRLWILHTNNHDPKYTERTEPYIWQHIVVLRMQKKNSALYVYTIKMRLRRWGLTRWLSEQLWHILEQFFSSKCCMTLLKKHSRRGNHGHLGFICHLLLLKILSIACRTYHTTTSTAQHSTNGKHLLYQKPSLHYLSCQLSPLRNPLLDLQNSTTKSLGSLPPVSCHIPIDDFRRPSSTWK